MNTFFAILFLVGGLAILWKCAELMVAGAVGLAELLGVSPLVIGLTVVAMGTSAPEVAASIAGVLRDASGGDIAIGNVYGSNIANLALIGGLAALIRPTQVRLETLKREIPVMLGVGLLLWPFLRNSEVSRIEGIFLLGVFAVFLVVTVRRARKDVATRQREAENAEADYGAKIAKYVVFCVVGLVGLAVGAKMTVEGAVFIGEKVGLSKGVIALTVIAFGTSLPELVTCVVASVKGHHDISVGNLVGSNIFNTLLVTGAAGTIRPFELCQRFAGGVDYWIMIAISAAFAGAVIAGRRVIGRISGTVLVCAYVGYIVFLLCYTP